MQSSAPSDNARNANSLCSAVRVDTMGTGNGRGHMIFSRNTNPFIRGIFTLSVKTSGYI